MSGLNGAMFILTQGVTNQRVFSFGSLFVLVAMFLVQSMGEASYAAIVNKSTTSILIHSRLAQLESTTHGKIGVYAINTANNAIIQFRANERFPMGCTSKVMGVAAVLKKSMTNPSLLKQSIVYTKQDLTTWSPITQHYVNKGMTLEALCEAAIRYSDNTAMNLLVRQLGGLERMNNFARSIGDKMFRQDNDWPKEAMSGGRGNVYDSSTPKAMANSLRRLTLTSTLASYQRQRLLSWLVHNTTGEQRIRAGVPHDWRVGDKTGTGAFYGTTNDIGIIWPPTCKPIIIAIYYTSDDKGTRKREDVVALVTQQVLKSFAKQDVCLKKKLANPP